MADLQIKQFSKLGFILTAAGSAIGLGAIWRLPYLTAENGGGTFLFTYIIATIFVGLCMLLAELVIGKYLGNPFLSKISKLNYSKLIQKFLYLYYIIAIILCSFYFVVCGWSLFYLINTVLGNIPYNKLVTYNQYHSIFINFSTNPIQTVSYTIAFLLLTVAINYAGLIEGVERVSLLFIPLLLILVIIILVKMLLSENVTMGIHYLTSFHLKDINLKLFISALGQALFSLSVGQGIMVTFSSFVRKDYNITGASISITLITLVVSLLTVFLIIPPIFFAGFNQESGVGLTFHALPLIFAGFEYGTAFASLFFLLMVIAAITSTISLTEVVITYTSHIFKCSRKIAILITTLGLIVLTSIQALSFSVFMGFKIFNLGLFDFANQLSNILFVFAVILVPFIIGWGMKKADILKLVTTNHSHAFPLFNVWLFTIKYIIPVGVPIILIISMFL